MLSLHGIESIEQLYCFVKGVGFLEDLTVRFLGTLPEISWHNQTFPGEKKETKS